MSTTPPRSRSQLDRELMLLRDNVLRLSTMVDAALQQLQQINRQLDVAQARQIIADDTKINRLRYKIEEDAYKLIARHQPTARDLRGIITSIHIAVELERIGDYAAGNSRLLLEMVDEALLISTFSNITRMLDLSRQMMRNAMNAYVHWDEEQARRVIQRDNDIDAIDKQVYQELIDLMTKQSHTISHATYMLWISHNCERIGDRITNICERIIYMVSGEMYYGIRQKGEEL